MANFAPWRACRMVSQQFAEFMAGSLIVPWLSCPPPKCTRRAFQRLVAGVGVSAVTPNQDQLVARCPPWRAPVVGRSEVMQAMRQPNPARRTRPDEPGQFPGDRG